MKKFLSVLLALLLHPMFKKILITLGCLTAYFFIAGLAVGLILFLGGALYAVWYAFWNLLS